MADFSTLSILPELTQVLASQSIVTPTPVQEKTIPAVLAGEDAIICAPPGSGKTLAFLLPTLSKLNSESQNPQIIILTPTHELAMQIYQVTKKLLTPLPFKAMPIIGKINFNRQIDDLKKEKPQVIIGSTGRILELAEKKKIKLHEVRTVVLDEVDRLLCKETMEGTKQLMKCLLRDKQILMYSASITKETQDLAKQLSPNFKLYEMTDTPQLSDKIIHLSYMTKDQRDKIRILRSFIAAARPRKAIIFLNQSEENERLSERLNHHDFKAVNICGNHTKLERAQALQQFRQGNINLLIATDVAARGLDFTDISHVIHVDLPQNALVYLHRAGRTGRAGKTGTNFIIATEKELPLLKRWEKHLHITIDPVDLRFGKIIREVDKIHQSEEELFGEEFTIAREQQRYQKKKDKKKKPVSKKKTTTKKSSRPSKPKK